MPGRGVGASRARVPAFHPDASRGRSPGLQVIQNSPICCRRIRSAAVLAGGTSACSSRATLPNSLNSINVDVTRRSADWNCSTTARLPGTSSIRRDVGSTPLVIAHVHGNRRMASSRGPRSRARPAALSRSHFSSSVGAWRNHHSSKLATGALAAAVRTGLSASVGARALAQNSTRGEWHNSSISLSGSITMPSPRTLIPRRSLIEQPFEAPRSSIKAQPWGPAAIGLTQSVRVESVLGFS